MGTLTAAMLAAAVPAASPVPVATAGLPAPRSGAEVVYPAPDGTFTLDGRGYGHGIGMSQYGAHGRGKAGHTYPQILSFYYPGASRVSQTSGPIRVEITRDSDGAVEVAASPGLTVVADGARVELPTAPSRWRVRGAAAGCMLQKWANGSWQTHALRPGQQSFPCPAQFVTDDQVVRLVLTSGEVAGYRGRILAVRPSSGSTKLVAVNRVALESYLRSVVPSESPPYFDPDALRAQAVAARTYAKRDLSPGELWDTCDSTRCQVYSGTGTEDPRTDRAVAATARQVLTYSGKLALTMFSSSNGGQSAPGGQAYLVSRSDSYDHVDNSRHTWSTVLTARRLANVHGLAQVERVQVLSRDGHGEWGGRVQDMLVEGTTAAGAYKSVPVSGPSFRFSHGLYSHYFRFRFGTPDPEVGYDGDGYGDVLMRRSNGDLMMFSG
ncbi:SpoIID/LytB domain-containing protein, partial [Ornithinicoccus halotolerans]|uniref:SpoIID/LytB domain-containing protein n=1 Tax=Ornithinicoccus halotolerans TaxID=1748220 RepID=UPI001E37462B